MLKKITAIVLTVGLLLASLTVASASGAIRNLEVASYDATSVGISWDSTDPDGPLFTVTCQAEGTDRSTERRTYHTYCVINYLSPDTTYTVTISTKAGAEASITFTMPTPSAYTSYNYQLLDTGVFESEADDTYYTEVTTLDAAALYSQLSDTDFSFLLHYKMSATSEYKTLDFELVLSMPNNDVYTIADVFVYGNDRTTVTEYYPFNTALKRIYNDYGTFPAGEYTLTAYIDDGIAAETTFTVE